MMTRRELLESLKNGLSAGCVGFVILFGGRALRRRLAEPEPAPTAQHPLRPPGAIAEDAFRAKCTRCMLCGEACPVHAIRFVTRIAGAQADVQPGPLGFKREPHVQPIWAGDDTPYLLPWKTACILCMECTRVCPTGALLPIEETREAIAASVRMGVAQIDRKICLPWNRRSWCGACLTICPYREKAITVDYQSRPTVHPEHCVGCGLCVEICPIRYKAISVLPPFYPDVGDTRAE
ncbi:MAG: hypothetical protein CO108_29170 [Deltaproteobacteria bacterium CG_4_9_14_3_um_filter_63_12]|nr:MAG: hypothetical protein CO108_29170 [Deltaproteobacteria bacterium CG_4_9_14_3_um_filter_63_12]